MSKCTWCTRDTQETCPECGGTGYKLPKTAPSTPIDKEAKLRTYLLDIFEHTEKGLDPDASVELAMTAFDSHLRSILDEVILKELETIYGRPSQDGHLCVDRLRNRIAQLQPIIRKGD